ncbi:MAG: wax ester/triacylglycerol synthase family O-acyltransferase [Myxococcales bacterium]|nr:wax ester/triacylglycerol synthase family O-acyltransferase [Myxococcales bacterium]
MAHYNYNYDRLSVQDNSFLLMESESSHMHVSSTLVYEAGPLRTEDGGIDINRIMCATESFLHRIPRYRQKLHFIPFFDHAVWVDDRHFKLDYHVRHTALPDPGTDEQLQKLSSRIMAQPLDRARPLWETWIVEGLEGDRFAVITKIHHCMIDGASGLDLAQIMMSPSPVRDLAEVPRFIPRPVPSPMDLVLGEVAYRLSLPMKAVQGLREFASQSESVVAEIGKRAKILGSMLGMGLTSTRTALNGPLGPHRSFAWLDTPLEDIKAMRRGLDCSVNDVVLTIVTGAIRGYMLRRGVDPATQEFKISAPVSVRRNEEQGKLGNRVSSWILALPVHEEKPLDQLKQIYTTTQRLKETNQALGVEMLMTVAEWTPASLLSLGSRSANGPVNSIVTNIPGPQFPLYMQGSKLLGIYPQVPLLEGMGLGIALMSYDGTICWGFNANPDVVPDLQEFVKLIAASTKMVAEAAGVVLSSSLQQNLEFSRRETETEASESEESE